MSMNSHYNKDGTLQSVGDDGSFWRRDSLDGKHLVWEICKQFGWILKDPVNLLLSHLWEQPWLWTSTFKRRYQLLAKY